VTIQSLIVFLQWVVQLVPIIVSMLLNGDRDMKGIWQVESLCYLSSVIFQHSPLTAVGVKGAGLVQWTGGPLDASFGFYLRER